VADVAVMADGGEAIGEIKVPPLAMKRNNVARDRDRRHVRAPLPALSAC